MTYKINQQRQKLRKDMVKAGFNMGKNVNFFGKKMALGKAITIMDTDDIKDSRKLIFMKKQGVPFI